MLRKQDNNQLTEAVVCSCRYCRNHIKETKAAYSELVVYLDQLGVDIEKPFETIPVDTF